MKQTLEQALHLVRTGEDRDLVYAANRLHGVPEGGWAETIQALSQMEEYLPFREDREYTVREFIGTFYDLVPFPNSAGVYRCKDEVWERVSNGDNYE